jgi:hypothetical protein
LGKLCPTCRHQKNETRHREAQEREAANKLTFEQAGALRRIAIGMRRGAFWSTLGIVALAVSLFTVFSDAGGEFPFKKLSLNWVLCSLAVVGVAILVGYLTAWYLGLLCLISLSIIGGAVVGGIYGWLGQWEIFT